MQGQAMFGTSMPAFGNPGPMGMPGMMPSPYGPMQVPPAPHPPLHGSNNITCVIKYFTCPHCIGCRHASMPVVCYIWH
jgi:hypothetical protein